MIEVRECVTAQTGFEYEPLPENFGPEFILNPPEEMVRQSSQEIPPEVDSAFIRCVFDVGYEDNFFPPEDHENLRNSFDG